MKRWVLALLLVAACKPSDRPRPKKLVLYCSAQHEWCEALSSAYEQTSGVRVSMIRKSSGEAYAQLVAERRNPKGDVWWGGTGDTHFQAAAAGLTEVYRSPRLAELHPWAVDPAGHGEHRTTGVYMGALGFGYNREWLAKKKITPPRSWADLLRPELDKEIQIANPSSSGTAYTALATIVQLFGEDEGFDYLAKLDRNVNQYTKSGAAPIRAAARGETGVGVVFLHDVATQIASGFPIEMVVPREGTGYEIGCMSLVRGARHEDEAKAFFDWALSKEAQELGAGVKAFQIPSNRTARVPKEAPIVPADQLIDFDFERFSQASERSRLLSRFERDVRGAAE
ncbi:MAG: ABC transporter substrate-binding protein [Deltaproteobacteria bacterium]